MLEDIKMLLSITDTSKDELINYHIGVVTKKILNYTGQITLPMNLEYVVVEVVVNRMNGTANNTKSVTRGDIKIEYQNTEELQPYEKELSNFKTVRII